MSKKKIFCIICSFVVMVCQAQVHDAIHISEHDLKISKERVYDRITWKSEYMTSEEGKPELPYYKVSYVLPVDAVVREVTFRNKTKQQVKEKLYINPVQPPLS